MKALLKKIFHYLFRCPTFWHPSKRIICPNCGKRQLCYWDGNDRSCGTIDICSKCYQLQHAGHDNK